MSQQGLLCDVVFFCSPPHLPCCLPWDSKGHLLLLLFAHKVIPACNLCPDSSHCTISPTLCFCAPFHSIPWAAGIFVPSVLLSWVHLAAADSCFAATGTWPRLWPLHHRGKIPGMSRNSLEEKTEDEELIWILPEAVMTCIRHRRLWLLSQPLNEPDQCCRSNTLGFEYIFCQLFLLCLLPHSTALRWDPSDFPTWDVMSAKRHSGTRGREGAAGRSGAPRHTQLMLPGLTVLDACSAPWKLSCFYWRDFFFSLDKANNFSHALFTSRQAARTYLCLWLHPLLSKSVLLFYLLTKHF